MQHVTSQHLLDRATKGGGGCSIKYNIVLDWRQWVLRMRENRKFTKGLGFVCDYWTDGINSVKIEFHRKEHDSVADEIIPSND